MSPENQLAADLERVASKIDVDVSTSFQSVARIARRKRVVRRSMLATALVAVIAGAVFGGLRAIDAIDNHNAIAPIAPRPSTSTSGLGHEAYGRIAGTYTTTVPPSGGVVSSYHLAGQWKMTLQRSGSVTFAPTFGFIQKFGPPELSPYSLAGSTFMTTALTHEAFGCRSSGVYRWRLENGMLRFTTLKDECPYRPAVFASSAWKRQ